MTVFLSSVITANNVLPIIMVLNDMESLMNRSTILIISSIFLTSCGENKEEVVECPTVIDPVIIPAVRLNLFDVDKAPVNVCDAILTIDNSENHQTVYGSAFNNCEERFSLEAGYNLIEHDVLLEKAGFINQEFEDVLPLATQCSYETLEINVYLQVD